MVYPRTRGSWCLEPQAIDSDRRISWILSSHTSALIARFLLGLDVLALITLLGGADREARSGGMVGQNGTAITPTGKDRIAVYGAKTVLFGALLVLSGCTREEATASLRAELQGR